MVIKIKKEYSDNKLLEYLLDGLFIDGAHHKQNYLAKAVITLIGLDQLKAYIAYNEDFKTYEEYVEEFGEFDFGVDY